ncbi:MAG TPA: N-6 DNA methylase [Candidatus Deferrimicrobiaceae bacterium]|jgi:hypothetical protein|nr:N-6 DNA methylase [Candidatus Deferrimicrobiaceae bacterium]
MSKKTEWIPRIRKTLREILDRCRRSVGPTKVPGEGEERALRGWLIHPFLTECLGWPPANVQQGERFDILLKDAEGFPVVYIKTQAPDHLFSSRDREEFGSRVHLYPTLRIACLTNGRHWEWLEVIAPRGTVTIHGRHVLDMERCTDDEAEAMFLHCRAERYLAGGARIGRSPVAKEFPHILASLAADLDQGVDELAGFLERTFETYERGDAGPRIRDLTIDLFDHWCRKSLLVPLRTTVDAVHRALSAGGGGRDEISKVFDELGFPKTSASGVVDSILTMGKRERSDKGMILDRILTLYRDRIATLAAQSAHVILARILIFRIGEDKKVFGVELSGNALDGLIRVQKGMIGQDRFPLLAQTGRIRERLETFLPSVFRLGEFDWWWVPPDKRSLLTAAERFCLETLEQDLEVVLTRILKTLDGYTFGDVDVDVWRNVYQHYLPDEERQRLGGFYTPDELVDLILDFCGYIPGNPDLAAKRFIDPACGSGAFVTAALSRLLRHFEPGNPGHVRLGDGRTPPWKRAEAVLRIVEENLHGIDIHPFAAFLTTINVMFLLLPAYVEVRRKNPGFTLDLRIFSADTLEKPDAEVIARDLFEKLNSRIQLSADALDKYQRILGEQFDFVFGNPPWGGVLKGPLAPVFDEAKKKRFRSEYPAAANGKYDIYGLFMERGLQILKPGGRLGLVTQDTYLDKEWAAPLRKMLAKEATVRMIVDLNPFGQLFFRAMNTPAVTVIDNAPPGREAECIILISRPEGEWKKVLPRERRTFVIGKVRDAVGQGEAKGKGEADFAQASRIPVKDLATSTGGRWNLSPGPSVRVSDREGMFRVVDLFDPRQGVTPGACLNIFLMDEKKAAELKLEKKLVHKAIKSREFIRWRTRHEGRVLLYSYVVKDGEAVPAFTVRAGVSDALDFETPMDDREKEIRRGKVLDAGTIGKILEHRIAREIVKFPNVARYVSTNYELLGGRIFKKKNVREFSRQWYEYLWPRDPKLMLGAVPRIVSPGLCKVVTFALDEEGYLSDHACQYLFPRRGSSIGFDGFSRELGTVLGREVSVEETLAYCLAFLNSSYAQEVLVSGRRPTPKGFYQISEEYLKEVQIALPAGKREGEALIASVKRLLEGQKPKEAAKCETVLDEVVGRILTGEPSQVSKGKRTG